MRAGEALEGVQKGDHLHYGWKRRRDPDEPDRIVDEAT